MNATHRFQVLLLPQHSKETSWGALTSWVGPLLLLVHFSDPFCEHPSQSKSFCKQMSFPTLSGVLTTQWTMKFMVCMVIHSHVSCITVQGVHTALCGKGMEWCEKTKNGNTELKVTISFWRNNPELTWLPFSNGIHAFKILHVLMHLQNGRQHRTFRHLFLKFKTSRMCENWPWPLGLWFSLWGLQSSRIALRSPGVLQWSNLH